MAAKRNPRAKKPKPKTPPSPAERAWYEAFRVRLIFLREKAGYSQVALADLLDIPLSNYKQIEGQRATRFPLHKLEKLARALRVPLEVVITGKLSRRALYDEDMPVERKVA